MTVNVAKKTTKVIDVVHSDAATEIGAVLLADPSLTGLTVDVVRPGSARFSNDWWPDLEPIDAVVSRWYDDDVTPVRLEAAVGFATPRWTFAVTEHVAIDGSPDWPLECPTPGLKHISLLCAAVPTTEFRAAYRDHVDLVHVHLPTMWRYVQNDVDSATGRDGTEFAAISELSYRSEQAYESRWARGAESEVEFRSHEGFLDLPRTVTVMCDEHVLRHPRG